MQIEKTKYSWEEDLLSYKQFNYVAFYKANVYPEKRSFACMQVTSMYNLPFHVQYILLKGSTLPV